MTRKDFVIIAAGMRNAKATPSVVAAMASALRETNPRFDVARFIAAASPAPAKV
jgi:hypothetical protein